MNVSINYRDDHEVRHALDFHRMPDTWTGFRYERIKLQRDEASFKIQARFLLASVLSKSAAAAILVTSIHQILLLDRFP